MMKIVTLEKRRLGIFILFLAAFVPGLDYAASSSPDEGVSCISPALIETDEILKLNATMRRMVDLHVKPIKDKERRAQALYDLVFGSDKFAIKYDNSHTKTAAEDIAGTRPPARTSD